MAEKIDLNGRYIKICIKPKDAVLTDKFLKLLLEDDNRISIPMDLWLKLEPFVVFVDKDVDPPKKKEWWEEDEDEFPPRKEATRQEATRNEPQRQKRKQDPPPQQRDFYDPSAEEIKRLSEVLNTSDRDSEEFHSVIAYCSKLPWSVLNESFTTKNGPLILSKDVREMIVSLHENALKHYDPRAPTVPTGYLSPFLDGVLKKREKEPADEINREGAERFFTAQPTPVQDTRYDNIVSDVVPDPPHVLENDFLNSLKSGNEKIASILGRTKTNRNDD